jgi:hypothetical protein
MTMLRFSRLNFSRFICCAPRDRHSLNHSFGATYITEETTHANQDQQYNNQCCEYRLSALYPRHRKSEGALTIVFVNNVEPTNSLGTMLLEDDEAVEVWNALSREAKSVSPK